MSAVIEVEGLTKQFRRWRGRKHAALSGLDLLVPEGGVFGFLGPNGSGKTTTIRCLLGMSRPSGGACRLFGLASPDGLPHVLPRVGAIVEAPAFFPTFSGRRNLRLLARVDGIGETRVEAVLEQVGLAERADDLVRGYSLGMRQRLGLAQALLKDPELLVLDEPANGLDPAGIKEIRELLRALGAEGRTVFVSSHLLTEIEHTCDRVAILSRGRCVATGTVGEVLHRGRRVGVIVRLDDPGAGLIALRAAGYPTVRDADELRVEIDPSGAAQITEVLGRQGLWVKELRPDEATLEEAFLELTAAVPEEVLA
jgi:ABC-2 type transport system ATP-binding protein